MNFKKFSKCLHKYTSLSLGPQQKKSKKKKTGCSRSWTVTKLTKPYKVGILQKKVKHGVCQQPLWSSVKCNWSKTYLQHNRFTTINSMILVNFPLIAYYLSTQDPNKSCIEVNSQKWFCKQKDPKNSCRGGSKLGLCSIRKEIGKYIRKHWSR